MEDGADEDDVEIVVVQWFGAECVLHCTNSAGWGGRRNAFSPVSTPLECSDMHQTPVVRLGLLNTVHDPVLHYATVFSSLVKPFRSLDMFIGASSALLSSAFPSRFYFHPPYKIVP